MPQRRSTEIVVAAAAAAAAARLLERGWVARFTQRFSSIAIRQGIRNGSRPWLYAWAAAATFRGVQRFVGRKEEVTRVRLRRGEALEIREVPRTKRRA